MLGLVAVLSTWASVAVAGGVVVESVLDCPDAAAVAERLAPLLSGDPDGRRLLVQRTGESDEFRLRFEDASGNVLSERLWHASSDCGALADEVAVVAAAWLMPPAVSGATLDPIPPLHLAESPPLPATGAVPVRNAQPFGVAVNGGIGLALGGVRTVAATRGALGLAWDRGGAVSVLLAMELAASSGWERPLVDGSVQWRAATLSLQTGIAMTSASGMLSATLACGVAGGALLAETSVSTATSTRIEGEAAAIVEGRGFLRLGAGPRAPRLWLGLPLAVGLVHHRLGTDSAGAAVEVPRIIWGPVLGIDFRLPR